LSASDPISFVGTTLLFTIVSALATWGPLRRATHVDPIVALRDE